MERIEDIAKWCLNRSISFKIESKKGFYYSLIVDMSDGIAPFRSATYHAETGRLILMSDYPECVEISQDELKRL